MTLLNSTKEGLKQVPSGSPGQIDFLAGQVTLKSYCKIRLFCLGKFCSSSVLEPAKLIGNVKIFLSVNNILFLFLYWAILNYSEKPGGYSGFQVTRMIEWRQKSKPKNKSLDLKLTPKKIPCRISKASKFPGSKTGLVVLYWLGYAQALPQIFRLFWIPQKYLPNCPTQKNPPIIPVTWNSEYPPWDKWKGSELLINLLLFFVLFCCFFSSDGWWPST